MPISQVRTPGPHLVSTARWLADGRGAAHTQSLFLWARCSLTRFTASYFLCPHTRLTRKRAKRKSKKPKQRTNPKKRQRSWKAGKLPGLREVTPLGTQETPTVAARGSDCAGVREARAAAPTAPSTLAQVRGSRVTFYIFSGEEAEATSVSIHDTWITTASFIQLVKCRVAVVSELDLCISSTHLRNVSGGDTQHDGV